MKTLIRIAAILLLVAMATAQEKPQSQPEAAKPPTTEIVGKPAATSKPKVVPLSELERLKIEKRILEMTNAQLQMAILQRQFQEAQEAIVKLADEAHVQHKLSKAEWKLNLQTLQFEPIEKESP